MSNVNVTNEVYFTKGAGYRRERVGATSVHGLVWEGDAMLTRWLVRE